MRTSLILPAILIAGLGWLNFSVKSESGSLSAYNMAGLMADTISPTIYTDLNGDTLDLFYNTKERKAYNLKNRQPVDFYINTSTGDTVYGRGRVIVNGYVINNNGTWQWDTSKVKIDESDGEIKIKDGDKKIKIDNGEVKIKNKDIKLKSDSTSFKLKGPAGKIKKEKGEELKVKEQ